MAARFFTPEELEQWSREDPARLLEAALIQVQQLIQRSAQLQEARELLKIKDARIAQLEESERVNARQAAPFRVKEQKRSTTPKRPGRKVGHPAAFRPRPEYIDEEIDVALSACQQCGAQQWVDEREIEQFIEDIPKIRPRVTRLRTYAATCAGCGAEACSRHPLQVSEATGAAGVHLGPQALALAADLNKSKGLTVRKTCAVLFDHFGLSLSPGGLCQAMNRVAERLEPQYFEIQQQLCNAPVVYVDETSWWIAGSSAWLWVFTNPTATFYVICRSRGREVLEAVLGFILKSLLVSDCLNIYDLASGLQHKCYSHHLKSILEALEGVTASAQLPEAFLSQAKELLKAAIALGKTRAADSFDPAAYATQRQALEKRAEAVFALEHTQRPEEIVYNRLSNQRDHLFTFLDHPGVDATNNLAERQLRPAVIARKLSCGNKTMAGARVFQILASVAATCAQTATSFIDCVAKVMPLNSG